MKPEKKMMPPALPVDTARWIRMMVWTAMAGLLVSCAAGPVVYRSDTHIVYQLREGDSPETVAEQFLGDAHKAWLVEDENEGTPFEASRFVTIPLTEENRAGLSADGYQVVPVLCYHHFGDTCRSPLCMPVAVFERQMKYLKDNGFRVISLSRLHDFLTYRKRIPKRSVVITIDDGYRSVYQIAYPILRKYGFAATLFIYTDFIGASRSAATWEQLREMQAAGFEIGSHTLSHCDLNKMQAGEDADAYLARIERELRLSKQILDERLNQDTRFFAFPYSSYNQQVLALCEAIGYRLALTVKRGGNPFFADRLLLKRDQVLDRELASFADILQPVERVSLR